LTVRREPSRRGEAETREWTYIRRDGSRLTVNLSVSAVVDGDGDTTGFVGIATDMTLRHEAERMKNEFVSVVSHELRTPLTSIRGSLGLLAGGVFGPLPERGAQMIDMAVANTDRLVRLINDILDVERIDSGRETMEKRRCQAPELVAQATDMLATMAAEAEVRLAVDTDAAELDADPDRIVRMLTNLISNAIKFSPPAGTVSVTCERDAEDVVFRVRDDGRGIPPDQLTSIFERFEQVDASDSREKGGTGLGLAIARGIVQQHGGRIWAESEPGAGATFVATLPRIADAPAELPKAGA
jgi:signal transduction histidine kinase